MSEKTEPEWPHEVARRRARVLRARILRTTDWAARRRLAEQWTGMCGGPVPSLEALVADVAEDADVLLDAAVAHGALAPDLACRVTEAVGLLAAALEVVPGARPHLAAVQEARWPLCGGRRRTSTGAGAERPALPGQLGVTAACMRCTAVVRSVIAVRVAARAARTSVVSGVVLSGVMDCSMAFPRVCTRWERWPRAVYASEG